MFCMRALRGEVEGGWAMEFSSFLGPMKWHQADRQVQFGAQKTGEFQGGRAQPPPTSPSNG